MVLAPCHSCIAESGTVLEKDVEALLDEEVVVQDNEPEGHRQHIVACALSEEVPNSFLYQDTPSALPNCIMTPHMM